MLLRAVLMSTTGRRSEKEDKGGREPSGRKDGGRKGEIAKERRQKEEREGRSDALRSASRTRACVVRVTHAYDASYVRYRSIRQFAIYCLDFNLPSEWPWALPPLPTDIRRRKLPIVSMELDSYCAPTFTPQQCARERASERASTHACIITTRVRSFGEPATPRVPLDFRRSVNQRGFLR